MSEHIAKTVAGLLGGEARHTGGGIWVVAWTLPDNGLVVLSDDTIVRYADEDAFYKGVEMNRIDYSTEQGV